MSGSRPQWGACRSPVAARLALAAALLLCVGITRAAVETVDDNGDLVRLPQPARRIVSLAPHLTELLFEAGAANQIVGTAAHSDFPAPARAIARVGDARALDLERIVALRPDLIVAWTSGSPKRQVERLQKLGYPLFRNEPSRLDDIATTLERLGTLAGTADTARERALFFRQRLSALRQRNRHAAPVSVFYQVWGRPLLTVNADHVIDDALRSCQARNVFAHYKARLPYPSREAVMLADPDAIIVADVSPAGLDAWRHWQRLRAIARGNLFSVDPSLLHRHTPRILDGVAQLCAHIRAVRSE